MQISLRPSNHCASKSLECEVMWSALQKAKSSNWSGPSHFQLKPNLGKLNLPCWKKKHSAIMAHERAKCYAVLTSAQDRVEWLGVPPRMRPSPLNISVGGLHSHSAGNWTSVRRPCHSSVTVLSDLEYLSSYWKVRKCARNWKILDSYVLFFVIILTTVKWHLKLF